jgi:signal transduction histidine kinase
MKRELYELEPGIIKNFSGFTAVRIVLVVFSVFAFTRSNNWMTIPSLGLILFALLDPILLFVYLSVPKLSHWLKRYYFPLGIIWATLGPTILLHVIFSYFLIYTPDRSSFMFLIQPVLMLFIPLVLISWQYSLYAVIIFSTVTFFIDIFLAYFAYHYIGSVFFVPVMGTAFIRTVMFLIIGNMIVSLMNVQRQQHDTLLLANERLTRYAATLEQLTTSRERNRMARELHDVLAHTMSGVAVELEGVRSVLHSNPLQAEQLVNQSLLAVREGLTETRRSLQALRASPLEDLGLGLAISSLADSINTRTDIHAEFDVEKHLHDYPVEVQQCFYRVAQEALSNIEIHAQATRVTIRLQQLGKRLSLSIQDDGVGFDSSHNQFSQKYGLLGMQERAEMIGGELSIESKPGSGTHITLEYGENE